jgi:hypothetical protein
MENLAFMRVARHLSIDASPYRPTKAANDIQLAAFFFGKSTAHTIVNQHLPMVNATAKWEERSRE